MSQWEDRSIDEVILNLTPEDGWSCRDAFEGTIVFGANGSGKTSGSGWNIAQAMLRSGFGGLILTAKADEADLWRDYCRKLGRLSDLICISPNSSARINFLDYELNRGARGTIFTKDLVFLLQTAMEGGRERRSGEPFWDDAVTQLLTNAIDLCVLVERRLSLADIVEVIRSAPASPEAAEEVLSQPVGPSIPPVGQVDPRRWAGRSRCAQLLELADARSMSDEEAEDFHETWKFWLKEYPALDARTRSNIVSTLMTRLTGLLRSPYRRMFSSETTVRPEDCESGRILIVDLPVKEYGEVGRLAQVLFKTVWQRAMERRPKNGRPVFLWADEAQYFVTKYDMMFQQTARASRAATVYLTQSVANFRAALGDAATAPDIVDSLLGTLQTRIFHTNGCPVTNDYAERTFGEDMRWMPTASLSDGGDGTVSMQEAMQVVVPAGVFTQLKKGGRSDRLLEAIVFQAGRRWSANEGKNWCKVEFVQGP